MFCHKLATRCKYSPPLLTSRFFSCRRLDRLCSVRYCRLCAAISPQEQELYGASTPRLKPEKSLTLWVLCKKPDTCLPAYCAIYFSLPRQVTQSSIADLSRDTQAGEATVIRFCRTTGYKGFQDFKMDWPLNLPLPSLMTVVLYWMPKLANPTMPTPLV